MRYERRVEKVFEPPETEYVCYRFTPDADGSTVSFGRTGCP